MKKNSVLLVEIGKLQGTLQRLESERKDCKVQLASVEEERRRHEASDKEKEIVLEDTRRVVEDLKAEIDILKLNISDQLTNLKSSALKENTLRSECDQKVEAIRTELQDSCVRDKERIEGEMNSQLAVMKKQLKIQYRETEHLDQMLQQQQQQKQGPGDGEGGGNGGGKAPSGNIPERQPQVLQREVPASQLDRTSRPADRLERGRFPSDREHPGSQRNLTYHSKRSRSRNSPRGRGSLRRGQPEPVGNDKVLHLTQAAVGHNPDERSSNISDRVLANGHGQKLTKESENEGIQPKEPKGETAEEQAKAIPEAVPGTGNSQSDQNAGAAEENSLKFQSLAQESRKSDTLGQRSDGLEQSQGQDKGNAEGKEVVQDGQNQAANQEPSVIDPTKLKKNFSNEKESPQIVEIPEKNLVADKKDNLPEDAQNRQLNHQDNAVPPQN